MPRVIISAGHTSQDPGTASNGLREVDLTRAISRKIIPHLRASGVITLSVPPNMDLSRRIEWINGTGYSEDFKDIAIEIHINDGNKSGLEFWHKGKDGEESKRLATQIMESTTKETSYENQGIKSEFDHEFGSLAFISNTKTISVLLECLYIDNPEDANRLKDESQLELLATGIAKGVLTYLGVPFRKAQATVPPKVTPKPEAKPINKPSIPTSTPNFSKSNAAPSFNNNSSPTRPNERTNSFSPPGVPNQAPPMSREQRKDMVMKMYNKVLGREPNQNDLNYFLNIGITEEKLLSRMIDSQEHLDMVKAKSDFDKVKKEYEKQKTTLTRLRAEYQDNRAMLQNLTKLLHQKNRTISEMKSRMQNPTQFSTLNSSSSTPKNTKKYKGSLSSRIFHFFSNILG
ncbi:N-acetylmuramoyl-L-alanine amidase [Candidatus Dojkabacteria bacterium]|uniref:N-acetylmuramoyl-L-alanine amidase n=2 Tax=Candidatus Dojkabacteria bacterium TaxID=2099670 RepID=A0A955L8V5_9BACT|nr:N-acetylmuramoyl-L-alanine amidase [Candidatus Dojkabacteria bacterium]